MRDRLTRYAYAASLVVWLGIGAAVYLNLDVLAATLLGLQGLALAADVGGVATRTSTARRWRELYKGQYSPLMMRVAGAAFAAGAAYWLFTLLR
jgi:hypothetical protein